MSPTVAPLVDVYVVESLPALTVIDPPAGIPKLDSDVFVESTAVPVPVAGAGAELDEDDDGEPVELDDDELVLPDKMLCIAADNWELTRSNAVWLAMLARPLPKLVSAELMALITESVASVELSSDCACCQ
jgi:hypothetical protein